MNFKSKLFVGLSVLALSAFTWGVNPQNNLGSSTVLSTGTAAGNIVQLDGSGRLPAVDGSLLTNISSGIFLPNGNNRVGAAALPNLTSGVNNEALGKFAAPNISTGSSNIAIGDGADVQNGSNRIAIGNQALATADNTAVLGDGTVTDVYFGSVSGAALLHADGSALTGFGSAAYETAGTGANQMVQLDGSAKLPAIDGSQLTNLPASGATAIDGLSDGKTFHGTGSGTDFLGNQSGEDMTSDNKDTALGDQSYWHVTAGLEDVAIGWAVLSGTASSGDYNTFVGSRAGIAAAGGSNTAVGQLAGASLTSGSNNTLVGQAVANSALTTGHHNTMIGDSAGLTLVSGDHDIYIGSSADASGAAVVNEIAIGDTGLGSNKAKIGNNSVTDAYLGNGTTTLIHGTSTRVNSTIVPTVSTPTAIDTSQYATILDVNGNPVNVAIVIPGT